MTTTPSLKVQTINSTFQPHFVGNVVTEWLRHVGHDRLMKLREPFGLAETPSQTWMAPEGFIFDGATIPRVLWTALNATPFTGDYRRAAVIHDLLCTPLCQQCDRLMNDAGRDVVPRYTCGQHPLVRGYYRVSSDEAAAVMYVAMITDGVTEDRARLIERSVRRWGPQFVARRDDQTRAAVEQPATVAALAA